MARLARVVVPGFPHHVTQRGNRRQLVFFSDDDYRLYLEYLRDGCIKAGTTILAYCLMPNHVHLLLKPTHEDGLRSGIAEAHRRYTRMVNFREGWKGHLWQDRFASFPTDEAYTLSAARYIELNPVRAKLVATPGEYQWSSAKAHLTGEGDGIVDPDDLLSVAPHWNHFLQSGIDSNQLESFRQHENTGRPLGSEIFLRLLEQLLDRTLAPKKRGRKKMDKK